MDELKTSAGRLREAGARKILELRGRDRARPDHTYQEIAELLRVSVGTVYNVCRGRTWPWLQPKDQAHVGPS